LCERVEGQARGALCLLIVRDIGLALDRGDQLSRAGHLVVM
jgi:hypothetical protein